MFRKLLLTASAAVLMLALHTAAQADPIATATISGYSLTNGTFTFTVCNTSASGSITAIGFDLPSSTTGTFELKSQTDPDFVLKTDVKAQAGAQTSTATFDFALLTGGNFGGGKVAEGIASGTCATFSVTGNFGTLSADAVARSIFLRFQGIGPQDDSIVVRPDVEPIPEPATMILLGTGLAGVAAKVRRRRKSTQS